MDKRDWYWLHLLRNPDFKLESSVEERIAELILDAEGHFGETTEPSAEIWRDIRQDQSSAPTVELRRAARWRDDNIRIRYENACRDYVKRVYFAYLNAYLGTAAESSRIRYAGKWLYANLLDQVFSEKWSYQGWDRQTEWLFFVRRMGNFIEGLPEWREYLEALQEGDRREVGSTARDQNPPSPRSLLLLDSGGTPQIVPELAAVWADLENDLDTRLLGYWETSSSISTNAGSWRQLIPVFGDVAAEAIGGIVRYLASKIGVDELLFEVRDTIIPYMVEMFLPNFSVPEAVLDGSQAIAPFPETNSFGLWEQHLSKTWQRHCQKSPSERDKTATWRVCYHDAQRRLTHRREFECALTERLDDQIVEWKSIAWRIKAAQKVVDKPGYAADLVQELADEGGRRRAQFGTNEVERDQRILDLKPSGSRDRRLRAFIEAHPGTTFADVSYSAQVHKPEFRAWRKEKLPDSSVMSGRIEDVLAGRRHLRKNPRRRRPE